MAAGYRPRFHRNRSESNREPEKQGIDKRDLGREGFLEKCWEWRDEYGSRIINQLKKMGSSADWGRERFTMDKGCSEAVT